MYAKKNRTRKSETTSPITSPPNQPGGVQHTSPTSENTSSPLSSSADGFSPENPDNSLSNSLTNNSNNSSNNSGVRAGSAPMLVQWNMNPTYPVTPTYVNPTYSPPRDFPYPAPLISPKVTSPVNPTYSPNPTYPAPPVMQYAPAAGSSRTTTSTTSTQPSTMAPPPLDDAAVFTPSFMQALDDLYCDPSRVLRDSFPPHDDNQRTQLHLSNEEAKGTG